MTIPSSLDPPQGKDVLASLREAQWDLVIVDEAHKMAAYRYGSKIQKTERYLAKDWKRLSERRGA